MTRPVRVRCLGCGRLVGARVPKGGDGTVVIPYRHYRGTRIPGNERPWCDGRFMDVSAT